MAAAVVALSTREISSTSSALMRVFYDSTRVENSFSESIEVEVVRLLKELKLPVFLSSEYRSGAATEATVVNPGYVKIMVREFFVDFLFCYEATGARMFVSASCGLVNADLRRVKVLFIEEIRSRD
ncbi:hypothetical protein D5086_026155 [Populus alba]|uniref:Uncharacterized protein n=1 Tax=Populus alba TaxID=43335 RepID=A0ACC4B1N1_POPAL